MPSRAGPTTEARRAEQALQHLLFRSPVGDRSVHAVAMRVATATSVAGQLDLAECVLLGCLRLLGASPRRGAAVLIARDLVRARIGLDRPERPDRDPDFPCPSRAFEPGAPSGRCETDGHYMCRACVNAGRSAVEAMVEC